MQKSEFIIAMATLLKMSQGANLFADGGFMTTTNLPCKASWEYKFQDKSVTQVSGCVNIVDFKPYPFVGSGSASASDLHEPLDPRTDKTKWCAIDDRYNAFNDLPEKREIWGYCLDKDIVAATPAPTSAEEEEPFEFDLADGTYAEGGFAASPVQCLSSWRYKDKDANLDEQVSGCVEFADFKPWPFATEDAAVIASSGVAQPRDSRTVTTSWCATRDVYNAFPDRDTSNRVEWGYCLQVGTKTPTKQPTTKAPTPKPTVHVTGVPTATSSAPSRSPTQFPTEVESQPLPTNPPVAAPTNPPVTRAPTPELQPSNDDPNPVNKVDVPTIAGISVAAVLVIVAIVLAGLYVQSVYKSKDNKAKKSKDPRISEENDDSDLERQERTSNSGLF